jgi:hypothetical protein
VWAAVSVVAADVTDRPAPVVAHHDVVVALNGGTPVDSTTSTAPARPSVPVVPSSVASRPATTVSGGRSIPSTTPVVTTTTTVPPPVTTSTTNPPAHPVPAPTTTAPAVGGTATYSNDGGVVSVACTSFDTIRLVAALPNDGFQAVVLTPGPLFVQVNFVGQGRNLPVSALCLFGQPFNGNQPRPSG